MTYLFTDYETTGFPKGGALKQAGQGRACQQAMLLTDENGRSLAEISSLITPDGWEVGPDAFNIHHFSTDMCRQYGMHGAGMVRAFLALASKAKLCIAHNESFDSKILAIECAYHGIEMPKNTWFCTMTSATPWCELPPTDKMLKNNHKGFKNPNLDEAYKKLCGKELGDSGHDALWDVRACKDIFFKILELQKQHKKQGELLHG